MYTVEGHSVHCSMMLSSVNTLTLKSSGVIGSSSCLSIISKSGSTRPQLSCSCFLAMSDMAAQAKSCMDVSRAFCAE